MDDHTFFHIQYYTGGAEHDTVAAVVHIIFSITNSSNAAPYIESQLWILNPKSAISNLITTTKNMDISTNIGIGKTGRNSAVVTTAPTSTSSSHTGVSSLIGTWYTDRKVTAKVRYG